MGVRVMRVSYAGIRVVTRLALAKDEAALDGACVSGRVRD